MNVVLLVQTGAEVNDHLNVARILVFEIAIVPTRHVTVGRFTFHSELLNF